ncbi:MAG: hypothetical protein ACON4T_01300 [Synechococcus sp.]
MRELARAALEHRGLVVEASRAGYAASHQRCYHLVSCSGLVMTVLTSALSSLIADPLALRDMTVITAITTITLIALLYGIRELGREIRQFRKVKA